MKRQTLTLLLAALAFALPCLAQTNFTFCHTYEARSARVFYSEVFSIAKGDTSWIGLMRDAFEKHIKANYDHIESLFETSCEPPSDTRGEARKKMDDHKVAQKSRYGRAIVDVAWKWEK